MGAFHAYDIRGIYNKDFDKETAYKVGFFLPELLDASEILVGRDVRESSPEIYEWLTKGITDSGADVCSIGLATTPMVYFATGKQFFN
jgi:phosphomannomutase